MFNRALKFIVLIIDRINNVDYFIVILQEIRVDREK